LLSGVEHLHAQAELAGITFCHGLQNVELQTMGRWIVMSLPDIDNSNIGYCRLHLLSADFDTGGQMINISDLRFCCWIGNFRVADRLLCHSAGRQGEKGQGANERQKVDTHIHRFFHL
jgi:hypothetical protein